ncbi:toxin-antitoxin system HicB family antitoxin, partial [Azotobacter chroococcum]|nr:toxin-antitoxin system HicB family antitoxin [Azotobacter chroococcum]
CKGSFNFRIGHELHLAVSLVANSITLSKLTRQTLSEYVKQYV